MIMDSVSSLKPGAQLLEAIRQSSSRKLSSDEILEQRISFVYGSMHADNGVTRERVRQVILEQVGGSGDQK